ncbi:MAG: methyltransferase [Gammaproteobacteria bacterium]|jgi:trimethylamine--corrinoid protein Co-methyltransferase|nr:methyltransferase [Gammaproteobacteria bacterium]|tara:strand:- start:138 stop:1652 length:1515 start_codon:yes stop_codon:yes gene_type:complete
MARRSHRKKRDANAIRQLPFNNVTNPYPPMEVLNDSQVQKIVTTALTVLESHGMRFMHDESRRLLRQAGANVDDSQQMVRIDRDLVLEKIAQAPSEFTLSARNPDHDLKIGANNIVFTSVGGPAFCTDLDQGRRPGTYENMCDYLKLVQSLNIVHQEGGGAFEAMDLPPESRHLDLYLAQSTLLDKNAQAYALGRTRTIDCIEMTCIAHGIDRTELEKRPYILAIINTNSPRQLDVPMSEAVIELALAGQVSCITPFTMAGFMSPVTLAGTLVQQTAEILAVATLAQAVRPGAPVIYGSFASNIDMQTGAPALGTPEYTKMSFASCQIARCLGLPSRSSNTTTSNCADAQSAYESEMSLWGSVMGHANLVNHAAGWLESGLTASFEKLMLDAEMLQMMAETLKAIEVSDEELALDAISNVEPGGHHFMTEHTLARYETAFYPSMLSTRQNFETWSEQGQQDATMRANTMWKQLLNEYERPAIEPDKEEALKDYVARRKREIATP